jgi:hypothetical protein
MEVIVLGIGMSITLIILVSMLIHFIRVEITVVKILNPILVMSFVLCVADFFKVSKELNFRIDRSFSILVILTLVFLVVIFYISATSKSKEEFVELYWKISKIENLTNASGVICKIGNCSVSGVPEIGEINLGGENYKAIVTDLIEADNYEYFCIDVNYNNIYCEGMEGPFKLNSSFLISDSGFNVIRVDKDNLYVINYPKEINVSNFKIGFVARSDYKQPTTLNLSLSINGIIKDSKTVNIFPNQEILEYFNVSLQESGDYRVRVSLMPISLSQQDYIDFWVRKN